MKSTCADKYQITVVYNKDKLSCVHLCDDNIGCSFFFYNVDNACVLYNSCNELRTPTFSGSTLKKISVSPQISTSGSFKLMHSDISQNLEIFHKPLYL